MNADEKNMDALGTFSPLLWLVIASSCAIHVYRNCRRIGEPAIFNVTGTLILFPVFYTGWLFGWPGTLRRWMEGGARLMI